MKLLLRKSVMLILIIASYIFFSMLFFGLMFHISYTGGVLANPDFLWTTLTISYFFTWFYSGFISKVGFKKGIFIGFIGSIPIVIFLLMQAYMISKYGKSALEGYFFGPTNIITLPLEGFRLLFYKFKVTSYNIPYLTTPFLILLYGLGAHIGLKKERNRNRHIFLKKLGMPMIIIIFILMLVSIISFGALSIDSTRITIFDGYVMHLLITPSIAVIIGLICGFLLQNQRLEKQLILSLSYMVVSHLTIFIYLSSKLATELGNSDNFISNFTSQFLRFEIYLILFIECVALLITFLVFNELKDRIEN